MINFPRNRILRKSNAIRSLCADVNLTPSNFIYPLFVCENIEESGKIGIGTIERYTIKQLRAEINELFSLKITSIMLFPYISNIKKCENGLESLNKDNLICRAIKEIKNINPDINIIADVALDPYTTHGHDGILTQDGLDIDNDKTLEILTKQALIQGYSGADFVALSDMMDGNILTIKNALEGNNLQYIGVISYAAKYASSLYSPFRKCINSGIKNGPNSKSTYQLDYRNTKVGIKSIEDYVSQGADTIIVKPAGWYLDVIKDASNKFLVPIFGYQVSGEYAMICNYASDNQELISLGLESIHAIKRAGANGVISYFSKEIAKFL